MSPFWCAVDRDVVRVGGADALSYLQSQLSQDIGSLAIGDAVWSLVLQPTGKVVALVRVSRIGPDDLLLDVDGGSGGDVVSRLDRFRIRVKVEIEPVPWRGIAVRSATVPLADLAPGTWAVPAWWGADVDLLGPSPVAPLAVPAGEPEQLESARVQAGWPAMGREITEATIPGELGPVAELAVSFTKGCYPGQELVERMDSRGAAAPRLLRRLHSRSDAAVPAEGSVIVADRDVGRVTSAAGPHGLALVGRGVEPGVEAEVVAGGEPIGVPVEVLPLR